MPVGYFAVLSAPGDAMFKVPRCHINLWALGTLVPGRRLWYADVGVVIKATTKPVKSFQLLLPFDVEDGGERDLFDVLRDQDIAELVFGGPVEHVTNPGLDSQILKFSGAELDCLRVSVGDITKEEARGNGTLVTVPLSRAIPARGTRYVRLRFRIYRTGSTWRWKGPWLARSGGRLDFRIADVRESRQASAERSSRERVLPVDAINLFVMLPKWLQASVAHPSLAYTRTLESGAWTRYLTGAPHLGSPDRLLVHYWKSTQDPVTKDSPFRAFLEVNRPYSAIGWWGLLRVTLGVLLGLLIAGWGFDALKQLGSDDLPDVSAKWLVGGSFLAVVTFVGSAFAFVKARARRPRLLLRSGERKLLELIGSR